MNTPVIVTVEPFGGSTRLHSPNLPLVYWDDAAVTRGDAVIETLLIHHKIACNFTRHIERLHKSAQLLGIHTPDAATWQRATEEAIDAWGSDDDASCTWTLSRGRESTGIPTAWVTIRPISERQSKYKINVMTAARGYRITRGDDAPWLTIGAKTLGYASNMAALRYAREQGFDDVIYVEEGRVLEGATSTVIILKNKKLLTPTHGTDVLSGTTQAAIFAEATAADIKCKQADLTLEELLDADCAWLVSSVRGPVRINRVDGQKLANGDKEHFYRDLMLRALHR